MSEVAEPEVRANTAVAVPGYVVGESIGSGGFGEVYGARHAVIGREVAIKVLHAKYSADETAVARFVAEARAVNQIAHPNIVQIFDFGTLADGRQYCVMERIRGATVRDVLRERGRLPLVEAMPILRGIAEAVDAAHRAGIAHRDLKPDNVFVLDGGGIKLIDFGLAKLTRDDPAATPVTRTGAIFGTPIYMSPEQCRGKALDMRTDCYSFGVLLYHMLVGKPPWDGDALELALHHLNDEPVPPSERCTDLDERVDRVVLALLAKSPARRPTPLLGAIESIIAGPLPAKRERRRRFWIAGAIAIVAGTAIAIALLMWTATDGARAAAAQWSARPIAWPPREFATAIALTPAGDALYVVLPDHTVWRRRFDDPIATKIELDDSLTIRSVSVARDGRLLVSRQEADGLWIWLESVPRGRRERVASGEHGRMGPDDRIAFVRAGEIFTRDLVTQQELLVASVGGKIRNVTWSPDGRRLAWTRSVPNNEPRAELLDTRDGSVRKLPDVLITLTVSPLPLAFTAPSTLVYCDKKRRLLELDLETGREVILQQLARNLGVCAIESTGSRVLVISALTDLFAAVLSIREPERGWRRIADGGVEDFSSDGDLIVAAWPPTHPPAHRTLYMPADFRMPAVSSYPLDGAAPKPIGRCPGAMRAVRRGAELFYNVNVPRSGGLAMQLARTNDCAVVDEWMIPDLPNWLYPRCGNDVCATVRTLDTGEMSVWTLRRGEANAREIARAPTPSSSTSWTDLAVSSDDRYIAVTVPGAGDEIYLIDAANGAIRTLHSGPLPRTKATTNSAVNVTFASDSQSLYVAGGDPEISVITRVSLDGTSSLLWSEDRPSLGRGPRTSADGAWLAANMLDATLEVQMLERPAP